MINTFSGVARIAHRGIPAVKPENSMASFKEAIRRGCDYIEFDVRKTKDDVPIIMHDSTLSRTTDGKGKVSEKTFSEIRGISLKHCGEKIPTLEEVIKTFEGGCKFNIEIKSDDTATVVVKIIQESISRGVQYDNFIVTSFNWKEIINVKKLDTNIKTGIVPIIRPRVAVDFAIKIKSDVVVVHHRQVTKKLIKYAVDRGIAVFVYTVNDPVDIKYLVDIGVRGIMTDDVRLFEK